MIRGLWRARNSEEEWGEISCEGGDCGEEREEGIKKSEGSRTMNGGGGMMGVMQPPHSGNASSAAASDMTRQQLQGWMAA